MFPLMLLMLVNLTLYLLGVGFDTRLVLHSSRPTAGNVAFLNPSIDFAYSNLDLRGPEPRPFAVPKPPEVFRIVVIGESTVQGFPYPSELAFPRQLEFLLNRQLRGRQVEVLNAGIVGVSTTPLVDLTRQTVVGCAPDLVVLYAGHNEFYGIGGVATTAPLTPLGIQLRRYRLIQWLSTLTSGDEKPAESLLSRLPGDFWIPPDSSVARRAEDVYRANLWKIRRLCEKAEVPLILCAVASNLRDQSPISSHTSLDSEGQRKRDDLLQSAAWSMDAGRAPTALKAIEQAEQLDPTWAIAAYRKAQCLEVLHRFKEAAACFAAARDLDACRFRAPGSFRAIVAEVASAPSDSGVHFVDLVDACSQKAANGLAGQDIFLEHVHFTFEGHWLVAQTLGKKITEDVFRERWDEAGLPSTTERDRWLGTIPLDHLTALMLASFVVQAPPLSQSADAVAHLQSLRRQIQTLTGQVPESEMRLFHGLDNQTKVDDLVHGLGQMELEKGETAAALAFFELAQRRRPWMPHSHIYAAICHHRLGNDARARADLKRSTETVIAETDRLIDLRRQLEDRLAE